ncbi:hypothetical protein JZ751_006949, partial [Albula glossodonta]
MVVQQPVSEPLQPGDSVSLQCSVHTETCAGEHSVYWFRQASGESLPGIIYTHGNRSDQCERSSGAGSPTQSCVYKLPKRNLSRSDAGTYYCAVATCGEILFGNGTKLELEEILGHIFSFLSVHRKKRIFQMGPLCLTLVLFCEAYGLIGKSIVQPNALVTAQLGDSVTLPCFCPSGQVSFVAWFKQTIGQKLHHIATARGYVSDVQFFNEFKESTRITAQRGTGTFNLTVSKIEASDSATYYCAMAFLSEFSFGDGALLIVMGSKAASKIVIQQPVSEPLQPGDSVSLQCSVHTETCAGEHSVYWFRQASGESLPGIIYTHGNRSDQCERSSGAGSPTQSCVYKLPKRNLSRSDAGTYYCAVATCGEILFGNGTKLDFE